MSRRNRPDHKHLSEVLSDVVKTHNLEVGLNQQDIEKAWECLMGNAISKYTQRITFKNNTLSVKLTNAVLRHELSMGIDKIKENLNQELGKPLIEKLILL